MAWLEKRNGKWNGAWRTAAGKVKRVVLYTDKAASRQKLAQLEIALAHGETGLADPFKVHRARPLGEHVKDWVKDLGAMGRDAMYVYTCEKRMNKLLAECGWKVLPDITVDSFCAWREKPRTAKQAEHKERLVGPVTLNQYLETARSFCGWCVKRGRMASNPLSKVEKIDPTGDIRRTRRALSEDELVAFIGVISEAHKPVYRFMLLTGLRRQEVEDLRWGDARLDAVRPFIQLRAVATKARRADTLPLSADLAVELRSMRGEAGDADAVFPAGVPTMDEHRAYLTAAEIDWKDAEGRRVDVHAMRHTFGTLLSKSGTAPREAMELMRHSDLRLTMNFYTDPKIFDLGGAVDRLSIPKGDKPLAAKATGTTDATPTDGRVANRVARATLNRQGTARIDKAQFNRGSSQPPDSVSDCQRKTPSGGEGVRVRHPGLEPGTR